MDKNLTESNARRTKTLREVIIAACELANKNIPKREYIIEPFLQTRSATMIFAYRGVGKTWVALELALSVAQGRSFFGYKVPKCRTVLYIDGEMAEVELQTRLKALCNELPENLFILCSESLWDIGEPLQINKAHSKERIKYLLRKMREDHIYPDLIIFDNLSCLTSGLDENDNTAQDSLLDLIRMFKHSGIATVWIHHAGKDGTQRGASRREDILDTCIELKVSKKINLGAGTQFTIKFTKIRGSKPDPESLNVKLIPGQDDRIKWELDLGSHSIPESATILKTIRDKEPDSQKALSEILGITESSVSKKLKQLKEDGYVTCKRGTPPEITEKGHKYLEEYFPQ